MIIAAAQQPPPRTPDLTNEEFRAAVLEAYRLAVTDPGRLADPFLELDCAYMDVLVAMASANQLPPAQRLRFHMPPRLTRDAAGKITTFEDDVVIGDSLYRIRLDAVSAPSFFELWNRSRP